MRRTANSSKGNLQPQRGSVSKLTCQSASHSSWMSQPNERKIQTGSFISLKFWVSCFSSEVGELFCLNKSSILLKFESDKPLELGLLSRRAVFSSCDGGRRFVLVRNYRKELKSEFERICRHRRYHKSQQGSGNVSRPVWVSNPANIPAAATSCFRTCGKILSQAMKGKLLNHRKNERPV